MGAAGRRSPIGRVVRCCWVGGRGPILPAGPVGVVPRHSWRDLLMGLVRWCLVFHCGGPCGCGSQCILGPACRSLW